MAFLSRLFASKSPLPSPLTSLNLHPPPGDLPEQFQEEPFQAGQFRVEPSHASQSQSTPNATGQTAQPFTGLAANPAVMDRINRRTKERIDAGQHPDMFFYLADKSNQRPFVLINKPSYKSILIYSSPALAHFLLKERNLPGQVMALTHEELAVVSTRWQTAGINSYIFNLSPKMTVYNVSPPKGGQITVGELIFQWSMFLSIRNLQAQLRLHDFYFKKDANPTDPETLRLHRAALESIRDCNAFDVPFVHWKIAQIASIQHDEPARQQAIAMLESFGPAFTGKCDCDAADPVSVDRWAEFMSAAQIGLLTEFEMLKAPDGSLIPSILRSEYTGSEYTPTPPTPDP